MQYFGVYTGNTYIIITIIFFFFVHMYKQVGGKLANGFQFITIYCLNFVKYSELKLDKKKKNSSFSFRRNNNNNNIHVRSSGYYIMF